jgi:hypothetical protein
MVRKRALAAGILAPIGNHSFRATGLTAYLANGGTLEHARSMAAHGKRCFQATSLRAVAAG